MKKAIVGLVLLLAGCGQVKATEAPRPVPVATPQWYAEAKDMVRDLNMAGVACRNYQQDPAPLIAHDQGRCTTGNGELVLSTYISREDAEQAPHILFEATMGLVPVTAIVGDGWMVNCSDNVNDCNAVQKVLLGQRVTINP